MEYIYKYIRNSNLIYWADYSGLFASCLCFVHCMALPLLLIFLPGLLTHDVWVHPVLCSIAIMCTAPVVLKETFSQQNGFFQFAVGSGTIIMLIILFAHDHLSLKIESLLNTIGGLCLVYAHYNNLGMKRRFNKKTKRTNFSKENHID